MVMISMMQWRYLTKVSFSLSLSHEFLSIVICIFQDPCISGRRALIVDIPEWAMEQNEEASEYTPLHVKLDDNWYQEHSVHKTVYSNECNKIVGICVSSAFRFNQHHPSDEHGNKKCELRWVIEVNTDYFGELKRNYIVSGIEYNVPERYHLWWEYVPCPHFYEDLKKALSKSNANGISEIEFFFDTTSPRLEVRNCAAWLVYEHDIGQYKQNSG